MSQRRHFISDQYHFIAEMIILSIGLLLPIHFYYMWVPKWSIFAVIIPLCIAFILLEKNKVDYKSYYLIAPLLMITFYSLLKFPLLLCLPVSLLIIWRYLRIRQLFLIGREASYILLTAMISIIVYIITSDVLAIGYLFLQLFVLVFGFAVSHVAVSGRRKFPIYQSGFYFICFFLIGAFLAFIISTQSYIERVLDNFIYILFSIIGRVLNLFSLLEPSTAENLLEGLEGLPEKPALVETPAMQYIGSIVGIYIAIGLIIAIFGLLVVLKLLKRDASSQEGIGGKSVNSEWETGEYGSYKKFMRAIKRLRIGKKHPVRIMIHEFERKAVKNKMGRKQSETLNEWFHRIGLQVNVEVYQKVRYGNIGVSEKDVEDLKSGLKKIEW